METLLTRYRNLTVLLIVVVGQLLLLAYQVKANKDDRLIRVWAVSAVTPMAGVVDGIRHNTIGFMQDYFILLDVRDQNRKLKADNDKLRMENIYFRNQLTTAEHARALAVFQTQTPSKTIAARVIGNSTVATAKAVFIDRGSTSGIMKGMAVVTPEGVVGKVIGVYPLASQVLLVTDPNFKVGIESQKHHVHGILNCGTGHCIVEQVQEEDKLDAGEWFFTSGEDRIFPRGFPVGSVISSQPGAAGQGMRDVRLALSAQPASAEAVLVVLEGIHQEIPAGEVVSEVHVAALPPPPAEKNADANIVQQVQTDADRVVGKYQALGKEENHVYGAIGSGIPNFNPAKAAPPAIPPPPNATANSGAITTAAPPPAAKPAPSVQSDSTAQLPLGSPRRKPATPESKSTQAPQLQP